MNQQWMTTRWNSFDPLSARSTRQWARLIESAERIPSGFAPHFPATTAPFPYTILVPPDSLIFRHFTGASLITIINETIIVLSQNGNTVTTRTLAPRSINCLEIGSVLLNSWMTIRSSGFSLKIPFNSVNRYLFDPLIRTIRPRPSADMSRRNAISAERSKFDYLYTIDYKYGNFGRDAIDPGDRVRRILYEKDRPDETAGFNSIITRTRGKRYRTSHCSILTDREIIIIRESEPLKRKGRTLYGKIVSYIPLSSILEVSLLKTGESRIIAIILPGEESHIIQYSSENHDTEAFVEDAAEAIESIDDASARINESLQ